jgi:hypothetical protein
MIMKPKQITTGTGYKLTPWQSRVENTDEQVIIHYGPNGLVGRWNPVWRCELWFKFKSKKAMKIMDRNLPLENGFKYDGRQWNMDEWSWSVFPDAKGFWFAKIKGVHRLD